MGKARIFREEWQSGKLVIAPGAYDCITARAVERAGFTAAYMSGAGTAAAAGYPDYGLLTMSEMVENAGRMASAITIPLIADADTGFGNELNAVRAIREYEMRGVAAIHVEDQVFPKKCGHLADKAVIPFDDYVAKIRAIVKARSNPDFTIIARSDARGAPGHCGAGSGRGHRLCRGSTDPGRGPGNTQGCQWSLLAQCRMGWQDPGYVIRRDRASRLPGCDSAWRHAWRDPGIL